VFSLIQFDFNLFNNKEYYEKKTYDRHALPTYRKTINRSKLHAGTNFFIIDFVLGLNW